MKINRKKIVLVLTACMFGMLCFTSCEDDYGSGGGYVGYDSHDDDWGKCSSINNGCNDETYSYNVNQK